MLYPKSNNLAPADVQDNTGCTSAYKTRQGKLRRL
jgi:hypothetical protein